MTDATLYFRSLLPGNSSSSADGSQHERRSDILPADPPTPVTRKSRGRKVPVSEGDVSPDPTRKIKCKMCDCWFCRGEHVKRHIATLHSIAKRRSINFVGNDSYTKECSSHSIRLRVPHSSPRERKSPDKDSENKNRPATA